MTRAARKTNSQSWGRDDQLADAWIYVNLSVVCCRARVRRVGKSRKRREGSWSLVYTSLLQRPSKRNIQPKHHILRFPTKIDVPRLLPKKNQRCDRGDSLVFGQTNRFQVQDDPKLSAASTEKYIYIGKCREPALGTLPVRCSIHVAAAR